MTNTNNPPTSSRARLISLNPEYENLLLFPERQDQIIFRPKTNPSVRCKIYQARPNKTFILNISNSLIRINDSFLLMNKEKELFEGDQLAFNQEEMGPNSAFEYVFCLTKTDAEFKNKRRRPKSESRKPTVSSKKPKENLLQAQKDSQADLTCPICQGVF